MTQKSVYYVDVIYSDASLHDTMLVQLGASVCLCQVRVV